MQGKIIKGVGGFYYVHTSEHGIYECRAKGIFRKEKIKPLVGDNVCMDVIDQEAHTGNVAEILPRKNQLIRPAVANIDQALVVFATQSPRPNFNLLDRFLITMEYQQVDTVICFNKCDLATEEELKALEGIYGKSGHQVLFTSAKTGMGRKKLDQILKGHTTAIAGPSGVGKSSLINSLQTEIQMETGTISEKIERGKHTTRHSQLICIADGTYIMDTPGFSTLYLEQLEKEELSGYFAEFASYEGECRFQGCSHSHEPDCGVKAALERGEIARSRYENYVQLYKELEERKHMKKGRCI